MDKRSIAILIWLSVSACGPLPTTVQQPTYIYPTPPANLAGEAAAQATQQYRAAEDAAATLRALSAEGTATSMSATRIVVAVTEQAQAVASATAGASTATAESQIVRMTEAAMSISATGTALWQSIETTRQSVAIIATATAEAQKAANDAALAADEALRVQQMRQAEALRLERQGVWNKVLPIVIGGGVLVAVLLLGAGIVVAYFRFTRQEVVQVQRSNGGEVLVLGPNGYQMLPPPRLAITAVAETDDGDDIVDGEIGDVPPADWSAFMRWNDTLKVPVGCDVVTRQPILINRAQKPHLLIAGTTGSGKTKTGLIPFVAANLGAGLRVVLMNGRGADFLPLEGHPNVTSLQAERPERPFLLMSLLESMVTEMDRRDGVLYRYAANNWSDLPYHVGESGEILVVVDEFLAIISEADDMSKEDEGRLWKALIKITNEARKFGMYIALTMTDPTARALGKDGMTVRSQMARMVMTMNEEAASRAILGNSRDFPYGTVGLPPGQFIATVGGRAQHGAGFFPSPADVQAYFDSRPARANRLPDLLMGMEERPLLAQTTQTPHHVSQSEIDGLRLGMVINEPHMGSFRAIGRYLLDREDGSVSGQEIDGRVKPALEWRVSELKCRKSEQLLLRSQG